MREVQKGLTRGEHAKSGSETADEQPEHTDPTSQTLDQQPGRADPVPELKGQRTKIAQRPLKNPDPKVETVERAVLSAEQSAAYREQSSETSDPLRHASEQHGEASVLAGRLGFFTILR